MKSCYNGYQISIKPGFWRPSNYSDLIDECVNMITNCEGGSNNFTCKTGLIGALCEVCDIKSYFWEKHYTVVVQF